MAPRKEKTEKASADEGKRLYVIVFRVSVSNCTAAPEMILNYLKKQNRPYSANDVSSNLHNKVTKAAAAKYLKDMHERKEIEGRAAGKQIVYHCIQNPADIPTADDLAALDTSITSLRSETASLTTTAKTLRTQLAALGTTLSTTDLTVSLSSLESEKEALLARLAPLRTGEAKPVSEEEKKVLEAALKRWMGMERRRWRIREELWGVVREAVPEGSGDGDVREALGLDD